MTGNSFIAGLMLLILGGIMEGAFSLPLKFSREWSWENTWGAGSLAALLLVAWPLAWLTIPDLLEVYRHSSTSAILAALFFGAGWGAGGIFFGLGLAAVGLSLGLSLIMGLIAVGGSIIPLIIKHPEELLKPSGMVLMIGILVMLFGLAVCARAGQMKEAELRKNQETSSRGVAVSFKLGLLFCIASGLLSALVNFGLIFGAGIADVAVRWGTDKALADNAVWALVFTSGYAVNVVYCAYLVGRRKSIQNFYRRGSLYYWLGAILMGVVWSGGIVIYGVGATRVGRLGAFLGFPIMLISSILAGNVLGALTGEWTGVHAGAKRVMTVGVVLLVLATGVMAYSNLLVM